MDVLGDLAVALRVFFIASTARFALATCALLKELSVVLLAPLDVFA